MPCPCCGAATLDPAEIKLDNNCIGAGWSDQIVRLTPTMARIARLLVRAAPGYVRAERMIDSIYGQLDGPEHPVQTLRVQMSHLRRAVARLDLVIPEAITDVGYTIFRTGHRLIPVPTARNISVVTARIRAVAGR